MFLTTALKDYVDQLNNVSFSFNDHFTIFTFAQVSLIYIFNSLKLGLIYIFSFQWLTDFVEIPCNFNANYSALLEGKNVLQTILETKIGPSFFSFTGAKQINENHFATGLFNSFFLALPLSVAHFLTIRAFLLNGIPAAVSAAAGTILGQLFFLTCVLFGFEWILIPWFSFEGLNYVIGLVLTVNILYNMTHKPITSVINQTQKDVLFSLFGINFLFVWAEQTSIFQYFGNLTVTSFPTLLQNNSNPLSTVWYLTGILIGSILWTIVFGGAVVIVRNWIVGMFLIPFVALNRKIHYATLFLTFVFCLTSIPYYGFDYLISSPLGFVSQDKSLTWTKSNSVTELPNPFNPTLPPLDPILSNNNPFDRTDNNRSKPNSPYMYEDYSYQPLSYFNNKSYLRAAFTLKKGQNKAGVSKDAEENQIFLANFYKTSEQKIDTNEGETIFENNVDRIANTIFKPNAYEYYMYNNVTAPAAQNQFQQRYYANPIYKALTKFEINGFLLGQPDYQNLTATDEAELYQRRVLFQRYLDSIEQYKSVTTPLKKPFAEKVYNQQFKGTLDLVRQFFSIELVNSKALQLEPVDNLTSSSVNGQPTVASSTFAKTKGSEAEVKNFNGKRILKYDQPLYNEIIRDFNPMFHEELGSEQIINDKSTKLAMIDSTPFYIGWDASLRKFLVKTNCIPGFPDGARTLASKSKLDNDISQSTSALPSYFSFQSWPTTQEQFIPNSNLSIPYTNVSENTKRQIATLFNLINPSDEATQRRGKITRNNDTLKNINVPQYNWSTLLAKLEFTQSTGSDSIQQLRDTSDLDLGTGLPPQFGGITWPGVNSKAVMEKLSK